MKKIIIAFAMVFIGFYLNAQQIEYPIIQPTVKINESPWYGLGRSNIKLGAQYDAVQLAGYYGLLLKTAGGELSLDAKGNVGIGTVVPVSKLHIDYKTNSGQISKNGINSFRHTIANTNVKSYDKGMYSHVGFFSIAPNITDSGYKIGVDASSFSYTNEFKGTLTDNYGIWARAGIFRGTPGAKINNAIAINAQVLDNVIGTTINNIYGVKISTNDYKKSTVINRYDLYAGTAAAKNYFAGKVGVDITSPSGKLDIGRRLGANNGLRLGDYIELNERETINNAGILSFNALIDKNDVSKFKPAWSGSSAASGMVMSMASGGVSDLTFYGYNWGNTSTPKSLNEFTKILHLSTKGNVGIGTTTPDTKLAVNGTIHTKEVKVDLVGWPDYVFANDYTLPTLKEVENHIKENGHLQNIPSAKQVEKNGIKLGEMNKKLLEKVEELTLYTIQQEKDINRLKKQEKRLERQENEIEKLKTLVNQLIQRKK